MFKKIGSALKGTFKGVKDVLPLPQISDSIKKVKINEAVDLARYYHVKRGLDKTGREIVRQFLDILDDGKLNRSVKDAKVEAVTRVIVGALPVLAWIIHGITTGNWIFF